MTLTMAFNVAWAIACTVAFPTFVSDTSTAFSNSVLSICFAVVVYLVLKAARELDADRRRSTFTHVLGLVFATMTAAGYALDRMGEVSFVTVLPSVLLFSHVYACLIALMWQGLSEMEEASTVRAPTRIDRLVSWLSRHWWCITLVLFACWVPCFLADFPGGFRYDASAELAQAEVGFNGNFPLLHSAIVTRLLPALHKLTGSYNTGVAVYVLVQMALLALMYTHMLVTLTRRGVRGGIIAVLLAYCALFPNIQALAVQEVRDVLFAGLLTYLIFWLYLMKTERAVFWQSRWKPVVLAVLLVLTLQSRNNNAGSTMLIMLAAICLLVWLANFRVNIKTVTAFAVTSIAGYALTSLVLVALCQPVTPAHKGASLSLMSQSLMRAYTFYGEDWPEGDIEELHTYVSKPDAIRYVPDNADSTKGHLEVDSDSLGDFLRFWLRIGKRYPGCYLDAILANTKDMWFPNSIIQGYNHMYLRPGQPYSAYEKSYLSFTNKAEEPVVHGQYLPWLQQAYTNLYLMISFERVPLVSQLFSIGFQFWIELFTLFYLAYRRMSNLMLPMLLVVVYMVGSAFVPLVILRYFAASFFTMPLVIAFLLQPQACNAA